MNNVWIVEKGRGRVGAPVQIHLVGDRGLTRRFGSGAVRADIQRRSTPSRPCSVHHISYHITESAAELLSYHIFSWFPGMLSSYRASCLDSCAPLMEGFFAEFSLRLTHSFTLTRICLL